MTWQILNQYKTMSILSKKVSQEDHDKAIAAKDLRIQELEDQIAASTNAEEEEENSDLATRVTALEQTVADHATRIASLEGDESEEEEEAPEEAPEEKQGKKITSLAALKKENAALVAKLAGKSSGGKAPISGKAGDDEGSGKKVAGIHPKARQSEISRDY